MIEAISRAPRCVLEPGCGQGATLARIKELYGAEVFGVELDESAASRAAERLDRVETADLNRWQPDYPAGYFDLIICADVLEHLVRPEELLAKLRPLLAPDGELIASIPNISYLPVVLRIIGDRFEYSESGVLDSTHLRFYTPRTMRRLFESAGYEVTYINKLRAGGLKANLANIVSLGLLGRFLSPQYLIKAKLP